MGLNLREFEPLGQLADLTAALDEHGEALAEYLNHMGTRDVFGFEDAFCGIYGSERDYTDDLADEMMPAGVPEFTSRYFDYEAFCRDLFINDNFSVNVSGGVAVFRHV